MVGYGPSIWKVVAVLIAYIFEVAVLKSSTKWHLLADFLLPVFGELFGTTPVEGPRPSKRVLKLSLPVF